MTEFIMVRHGEPDYEVVNENASIIISSPFTRCMQGACMMSKELQIDMVVEHNLHEWQLDRTHSVRPGIREKLLVWKYNHTKWNRFSKWEHSDAVKKRVLQVFDKYLDYEKVIVSCHAMMIMYTLGDENPMEYGEIRRIMYDGKSLSEVEAC